MPRLQTTQSASDYKLSVLKVYIAQRKSTPLWPITDKNSHIHCTCTGGSICNQVHNMPQKHFMCTELEVLSASKELFILLLQLPEHLHSQAHYSFDYVQQVHYPSDPMQPGPIYFLTHRMHPTLYLACHNNTRVQACTPILCMLVLRCALLAGIDRSHSC